MLKKLKDPIQSYQYLRSRIQNYLCPAAPKAAPMSWLMVYSLFASGMMTPWFFAPMFDCTRLPLAVPRV